MGVLGVRGFVPASMVEEYFVEDFSDYKGKTMKFKIIELEPSENRNGKTAHTLVD